MANPYQDISQSIEFDQEIGSISETQQSDLDGSEEDDDSKPNKKRARLTNNKVNGEVEDRGRRKISIEYIQKKEKRHITFSKRKAGIMKKAYELATLTGTQVLLLVVSETGIVYTYTTAKFQPLVAPTEEGLPSDGQMLIQACLAGGDDDSEESDVPEPLPVASTSTTTNHGTKISLKPGTKKATPIKKLPKSKLIKSTEPQLSESIRMIDSNRNSIQVGSGSGSGIGSNQGGGIDYGINVNESMGWNDNNQNNGWKERSNYQNQSNYNSESNGGYEPNYSHHQQHLHQHQHQLEESHYNPTISENQSRYPPMPPDRFNNNRQDDIYSHGQHQQEGIIDSHLTR